MTARDSERLYDDAAEQAVLGAILVDNALLDEISDALTPLHFRRAAHQGVFRAMLELTRRSTPIDPITLRDILPTLGVVDVTLGDIAAYVDGMPHGANVQAYAAQIRTQHTLRALERLGHAVSRAAEGGTVAPDAIIEDAEAELLVLGSPSLRGTWASSEDIVTALVATLEAIATTRGVMNGVLTGLRDLDDMTGGLHKGDLILLGARPSMGKTALALQMALHAARSCPVAFFSVEMGLVSLALRALAGEAQVDSWRLKQGKQSPVQEQRVAEALNTMGAMTIWIDESPLVSPGHVRAKLRRLRTLTGGALGLVVIDYLQLMAALPEHRNENKTNQVAGISRALKLMAREFDVPFLVLSQLNRGLERATVKTPSLADLRDSGALEQDADLVLLLHRPEVYDPTNVALEGIAQLLVAKHRNGATGNVDLRWKKEMTRFLEGTKS